MIAIVGEGRLGTALHGALAAAGEAVLGIPGRGVVSGAQNTFASADVIVLAVRDSVIGEVAAGLAGRGMLPSHAVLLHCSGALAAEEAFAGLPVAGRGVLHPLLSLSPGVASTVFPGVTFAVEGDAEGRVAAARLARTVGGVPVEIERAGLPLYHAGAVFASNYLPALLDAGARLLELAGFPDRAAARNALDPLVRSILDNALRLGPAEALTGPIARGDAATVARHLETLAAAAPDLVPLYRACATATVNLARTRSDPPAVAEVESLLVAFARTIAEPRTK